MPQPARCGGCGWLLFEVPRYGIGGERMTEAQIALELELMLHAAKFRVSGKMAFPYEKWGKAKVKDKPHPSATIAFLSGWLLCRFPFGFSFEMIADRLPTEGEVD